MKKLVFFICIGFGLIFVLSNLFSTNTNAHDFEVIPDDAIRLRILAHNDSDEEQRVKNIIRDEVSVLIESWVGEMDDIDEAREEIASRMDEIDALVAEVLEEEGSPHEAEVEYNANVQFPHKVYDNYVYPAGEYEAVLITVGSGEGSNWWCVLFPPLCFLDFGAGAVVDDYEEPEVEVKFFLWEWLKPS